MRNLISKLTLFLALLLQCCTDHRDYYTFSDHNFIIDYPNGWQVTHEIDGLKLSSNDNYATATVANYPNAAGLSLEEIRNFILKLNHASENPENVKMTQTQDSIEYYYEHTEKDFKWLTKIIRRNNSFHLLRINCQINKWELNKSILLHIVESFKFR
ncbi:MAG: hypothetical protein ABIN97_04215 [Ginsengibacter sp.]